MKKRTKKLLNAKGVLGWPQLRAAACILADAGIERAALEARWLGEAVAGTDLGGLLEGKEADLERFADFVARRAAREPLAYVIGHAPFRDLDLLVSAATLIPRADSETLIEAALDALPGGAGRVLDLGTGTGCLLLAALTAFPAAHGVGIDRAEAACRLARANAGRNGLSDRADFLCADWAAPVRGTFDLVLCNPPYIRRGDIPALMPEVAAYEPALALDGGDDGLDAYRTLLPAIPPLLAPGGVAIFELGAGQAAEVGALAEPIGLAGFVRTDSGGHGRALVLRRA